MPYDPHASVVTIDGPGGSGKGTLSSLVAAKLGWHLLDSGALYRIVAVSAQAQVIDLKDESSLVTMIADLQMVTTLATLFAQKRLARQRPEWRHYPVFVTLYYLCKNPFSARLA